MKYEMKDTHEMTLGSIKSLILSGVGIAASFSHFALIVMEDYSHWKVSIWILFL